MPEKFKASEPIQIIKSRGGVQVRGASAGKKPRRRTTPKKRQGEDYQARRAVKLDSNFYDLAFLKDADGVFRDLPFEFAPPLGNFCDDIIGITKAECDQRDALFFATDWKRKAKKVGKENAEVFYDLQVSLFYDDEEPEFIVLKDSDQFTEKGLKLTAHQLTARTIQLEQVSAPLTWIDSIVLHSYPGDPQVNRATKVYDFAAPDADYRFKNGDQVYIAPLFSYDFMTTTLGGSSGPPHETHYLNQLHAAHPREVYFNEDHPFFGVKVNNFISAVSSPTPDDLEAWREFTRTVEFHKTRNLTRAFRQLEPPGLAVADYPGPDFPLYPGYPSDPAIIGRQIGGGVGSSVTTVMPDETLVAIILRGSDTFYLWRHGFG
jgi:hypothetical protein